MNCEARFNPDEHQANVGHEGKDCQTFKSELAKAMEQKEKENLGNIVQIPCYFCNTPCVPVAGCAHIKCEG